MQAGPNAGRALATTRVSQQNVIFEICADDQSGEDVEVPYIMMKMQK